MQTDLICEDNKNRHLLVFVINELGVGTDVLKGLWESVSGKSGDVDLNNGKLQQAYKQHQGRIKWLKSIDLQNYVGHRTY